jgi:hypothetical protein
VRHWPGVSTRRHSLNISPAGRDFRRFRPAGRVLGLSIYNRQTCNNKSFSNAQAVTLRLRVGEDRGDSDFTRHPRVVAGSEAAAGGPCPGTRIRSRVRRSLVEVSLYPFWHWPGRGQAGPGSFEDRDRGHAGHHRKGCSKLEVNPTSLPLAWYPAAVTVAAASEPESRGPGPRPGFQVEMWSPSRLLGCSK